MLWNFFPYICIFLTAKENMSTSCFIMLHFTVLWKFWAFYKIKVCGNPALSKAMSAIFPTAFAHFVFLLYLAILITFQVFHYYYICDGDLWSVIFDVTIAKKKIIPHWRFRWWLSFFSNKVFFNYGVYTYIYTDF